MRPNAAAEYLTFEGREARSGVLVYGLKDISCANSGAVARRVQRDTLSAKASRGFDPANAVGGNIECGLLREIEASQQTCRHRPESEKDSEGACPRSVLHSF